MADVSLKIEDRDLGLNTFLKQMDQHQSHVVVGVFGQNHSEEVKKAVKNEFGDPNNTFHGNPAPIPARPFMRQTFDQNKQKLAGLIRKTGQGIAEGRLDWKTGLEMIGDTFRQMVRTSIQKRSFKPNSPTTIAQKGSDLPLVGESGRLEGSINYEVRSNKS